MTRQPKWGPALHRLAQALCMRGDRVTSRAALLQSAELRHLHGEIAVTGKVVVAAKKSLARGIRDGWFKEALEPSWDHPHINLKLRYLFVLELSNTEHQKRGCTHNDVRHDIRQGFGELAQQDELRHWLVSIITTTGGAFGEFVVEARVRDNQAFEDVRRMLERINGMGRVTSTMAE